MIDSLLSRFTPALVLIALSLLVLGGLPHAYSAQAGMVDSQDTASGRQAGPQMISATQEGLQFTLNTPDYTVSAEGELRAPGLEGALSDPGAPALPIFSTLVALPPQADVTVNVRLQDLEKGASAVLRPAGSPTQTTIEEPSTSRPPAPPGLVFTADRTVYEKDAYYPEAYYRLSEPMYYRDLRLVRLELFPLRYNPEGQTIEHAAQMHVSLAFHGARTRDLRPAKSTGDGGLQPIAPHVINFDQANQWRSLPAGQDAAPTVLPTGQEAFKIAVKENGVYEITCGQLQEAGMNLDTVDPDTLEMMHRGQPVAHDYVGDGDNEFCEDGEDTEAIRFYGWAFDGSRLERQFLTENVFWLWAGGTPQNVESTPVTTTHPVDDSFRDRITREPEPRFTHTLTDDWDDFPNEADAWYWDAVESAAGPVITRTYQITLPTPAASGPDAVLTAEFLSRANNSTDIDVYHGVSIYLKDAKSNAGNLVWKNLQSVNVTTTVPMTAVWDGPNDTQIVYELQPSALIFLNRITVEYERRLVAQNDRLIIHDEQGSHTYSVGNFSTGNALVWDISDRRQPRKLQLTGSEISGSNPYTYTFGVESPDSTDFIAATEENLLSPAPGDIERYVPEDLEPQAGGADWVAISYGDFMPATEQLAAHRADPLYGGLATHVVDVQDVIEQYGYGLPVPAAIQNYLAHALASWDPAPRYVLLVGDGHMNPRQLDCPPLTQPANACAHWGSPGETNYVLTDLVFEDEFAGIIPSDYTYALLSGDDLLPDVALGRLAVNSVAEVQTIADKIAEYEEKHLTPEPWQRNFVFVADNPDTGGNFCNANKQVITDTVPGAYTSLLLCLPEATEPAVEELQDDIYEAVNNPGATFLNYRGHGAIRVWGGSPPILNLDEENAWTPWSGNHPLIILSMDCWDGHFATPGEADNAAISEVFMAEKKENGGSVAHWSSTGLGYDAQHTVLHKGFYEGFFGQGLTTIGQAIDYAKVKYHEGNNHASQLYSFTFQGDPAMLLMRPELSIEKNAGQAAVRAGKEVTFTLDVRNDGLYQGPTTIVDSLPDGLSLERIGTDLTTTMTVTNNVVTFTLSPGLPWGGSGSIDLVAIPEESAAGEQLTNRAAISGAGLDFDLSNNESERGVLIGDPFGSYLPLLRKE